MLICNIRLQREVLLFIVFLFCQIFSELFSWRFWSQWNSIPVIMRLRQGIKKCFSACCDEKDLSLISFLQVLICHKYSVSQSCIKIKLHKIRKLYYNFKLLCDVQLNLTISWCSEKRDYFITECIWQHSSLRSKL